jgi:hypothetical protein
MAVVDYVTLLSAAILLRGLSCELRLGWRRSGEGDEAMCVSEPLGGCAEGDRQARAGVVLMGGKVG